MEKFISNWDFVYLALACIVAGVGYFCFNYGAAAISGTIVGGVLITKALVRLFCL